jgi:hypothetical protein
MSARTRSVVALVLALAAGACVRESGGGIAPKPPIAASSSAPTVAVSASASASSSAPAGPSALDLAISHDLDDAAKSGWQHPVVERVPKRGLALVRFVSAAARARVDLVAVDQPTRSIEGDDVRRVPWIDGEVFPDLRGDRAPWAVLSIQSCPKPFCLRPRERAFEATVAGWVESPAPQYPSSLGDVDGDHIPEFATDLVTIPLCDGCDPDRVPDGADGEALYVDGLESWDGKSFTNELASFRPWYERALAEARDDAKALAETKPKERKKACPRDVLQDAALIHVFSRVLGAPTAKADAEADKVMSGWDFKACPKMRGTRKSWPELRALLGAAQLPKLGRARMKP